MATPAGFGRSYLRRRAAILTTLLAAVPCVLPAQPQRPPDDLAIVNARVLPMDRDTVLENHTIIVQGGKITWLGDSRRATVPSNAVRVDAAGRFVMPGLADMHVHLLADAGTGGLAQYLSAGITTVRNMRGDTTHLAWRRAITERRLTGPRIYTAGPGVGRGLLGDRAFVRITTVREAERVVDAQRRAGYDMVKVFNRISPDVFAALGRRARVAGIPVVGHVVSDVGLSNAVAAGQVSLEHAGSFLQGDAAQMTRDARTMAVAGTWAGTVASDRDGSCRPPAPNVRQAIGVLRRAGVRLLVGSDAGIGPVRAGEGLLCELRTLAATGMSTFDVLAASTRDAGEFARLHLREREPFGIVAVGARADLLVMKGDPRRSLDALRQLDGVVLRGQWRPMPQR